MNKLIAKDYKVEELALLNMELIECNGITGYSNGIDFKLKVEEEMSIEEKIAFIDAMDDGNATYLTDIINKWKNEKESLPKDDSGNPKTVSKKAWFKRNDSKKIFSYQSHKCPRVYYYYQGTEFIEIEMICPYSSYSRYTMLYTGENIVHRWFHDLILKMKNEEGKYFKENDQIQKKLTEVYELTRQYKITFGIKELWDIQWNNKSDVSGEDLDKYIEAYKVLQYEIDKIGTGLPGTRSPE